MNNYLCKTNFHTHTTYCDGKSSMEDMILKARELNYSHLGFSSHAPLPFQTQWAIPEQKLENYFSDLQHLRQKYQHKIKIFNGLEIDFLPDYPDRISFFQNNYPLDYTIGAIHFIDYFENGEAFDIAGKPHLFEKGLLEIFRNNKKKLVERYFVLLNLMITKKPTIIAHVDFLKNQNQLHQLFEENSFWYKNLMEETLQNIKKNNCILEINTRGIYKGRITDFYPSQKFFEIVQKLEIPVIISTDAHHTDELAAHANEALEKASLLGLNIIESPENLS